MTTSRQPDWSTAPPDATHYHDASDGAFECWYKAVPDEELVCMTIKGWESFKPNPLWVGNCSREVDQLIARPDSAPENDIDSW